MITVLAQAIRKYKHVNWALADQAMVSGVNFITGIVLARYLGLEEFGVFTLAWAGVLFLHGLQLATIVNPMMSIGPKQTQDKMPDYYGAVLAQQIVFSLMGLILIFLAAVVIDVIWPEWGVAQIIPALAVAAFAFLAQDFLRKYLFTRRKPHLSFANDAISYLGQLGLLLWCFNSIQMNTSRVLWVIAATSAVAILLGMRSFPLLVLDKKIIYSVMLRNWDFARWMAGSAIVQWLSGHIFLIAAGAWLGTSAVGAMKSAQNIMGVSHIIFQAFENIVPAQAARNIGQYGMQSAKHYLWKVTGVGMLGTVAIAAVAGIFPAYWMTFFYGEEFAVYSDILIWYAFIYPIVFLSLMLRIWLRTQENTRPIFLSYVWMTIVGVVVVYPFIHMLGISGAMFGIFITNLVMVGSLYISVRKSNMA